MKINLPFCKIIRIKEIKSKIGNNINKRKNEINLSRISFKNKYLLRDSFDISEKLITNLNIIITLKKQRKYPYNISLE